VFELERMPAPAEDRLQQRSSLIEPHARDCLQAAQGFRQWNNLRAVPISAVS
jgi:hypothetical protein